MTVALLEIGDDVLMKGRLELVLERTELNRSVIEFEDLLIELLMLGVTVDGSTPGVLGVDADEDWLKVADHELNESLWEIEPGLSEGVLRLSEAGVDGVMVEGLTGVLD